MKIAEKLESTFRWKITPTNFDVVLPELTCPDLFLKSVEPVTFVHSFPGVVEPSSYRPPLSFLPRYNKFYHFLETLYSSTLLICTYQSKHLCLKKVAIGYTLASSSMFWFPTWAFLFIVFLIQHFLVFLSDRPTLFHMSLLAWIQYCFVHFVFQTMSHLQ